MPAPKPPPITKAQRDLWFELNTIIRECGAWTITQPDVFPIRFEAPLNSELPELLRQAGHNVIALGTHERLLPITETLKELGRTNTITRQQVGVGIVGVWQFDLPPVFAANAETGPVREFVRRWPPAP